MIKGEVGVFQFYERSGSNPEELLPIYDRRRDLDVLYSIEPHRNLISIPMLRKGPGLNINLRRRDGHSCNDTVRLRRFEGNALTAHGGNPRRRG